MKAQSAQRACAKARGAHMLMQDTAYGLVLSEHISAQGYPPGDKGNAGHCLSAAIPRAFVFMETSIVKYLGASDRKDGESLRLSAAA